MAPASQRSLAILSADLPWDRIKNGDVERGIDREPEAGPETSTEPTTHCSAEEFRLTPADMPRDDPLGELRHRSQDALGPTVQSPVEAEVTSVIRAGRHELTLERLTQRKSPRPKTLDAPGRRLQMAIGKMVQGSSRHGLRKARPRVERALRQRGYLLRPHVAAGSGQGRSPEAQP